MIHDAVRPFVDEETLRQVAEAAREYGVSVESWARDYKEKHKLDSKLISDSAFRTHLSFCKKQEIIKLFHLELRTRISYSGNWSSLRPEVNTINK